MHILYLVSWYPLNEKDLNGCFFREQALAMVKVGHKVGVIAPQFRSLRLGKKAIFNKYGTEFWQDSNINTYLGHDVFLFPKVPYVDLKRWVNKGLNLFERYIQEHGKPNIIHVQSMLLAGPLALKISRNYDIPYCIMEHSSTFARNLVQQWQLNYMNEVSNKSANNMAVSQDLANLLNSKLTAKNWHYFPNILDELFTTHLQKTENPHQFCAVAWLKPVKGYDNLIKAFAKVNKQYPDYRLVIGGDGPERENLDNLAKHLNLQESVQFLGSLPREAVKDLMATSFCYVLSSHVETFGVVVIEALSQGTPVIATRCGGPESILTDKDGLIIPVDDIDALADAMIQMIKDKHAYDREQIRQRCLARFSEAAFTKGMVEIYQSCIDKQ